MILRSQLINPVPICTWKECLASFFFKSPLILHFQFKSFCSSHRPVQRAKSSSGLSSSRSPTKNIVEHCSICKDQVSTSPSPRSIWTPCCGAFFHPACIQATSLSAGAYHFRSVLWHKAGAGIPNAFEVPMFTLCSVFQWHSVLNKMATILFGFPLVGFGIVEPLLLAQAYPSR